MKYPCNICGNHIADISGHTKEHPCLTQEEIEKFGTYKEASENKIYIKWMLDVRKERLIAWALEHEESQKK